MLSQISSTPRYPELDLIRGLAVISMIIYHAYLVRLWLSRGNFIEYSPALAQVALIIPVIFLLLVGISLRLVFLRRSPAVFKRFLLKRFVVLLAAAGLVSVSTYLILPQVVVWFGILHLIALSTLLVGGLQLLKLPVWIHLLLSFLVVWAGAIVSQSSVNGLWLLPLGLTPPIFMTLDYFPVFPWLGVVLFGLVFGECIYNNTRPTKVGLAAERLRQISQLRLSQPIIWLGRRALLIYLLHVPLLCLGWWMLRQLNLW